MEKSPGNPVPVCHGSSQVPSGRCVAHNHPTPLPAGLPEASPAATRASNAHAVWDAVDSPRAQAAPARRCARSNSSWMSPWSWAVISLTTRMGTREPDSVASG